MSKELVITTQPPYRGLIPASPNRLCFWYGYNYFNSNIMSIKKTNTALFTLNIKQKSTKVMIWTVWWILSKLRKFEPKYGWKKFLVVTFWSFLKTRVITGPLSSPSLEPNNLHNSEHVICYCFWSTLNSVGIKPTLHFGWLDSCFVGFFFKLSCPWK